MKVRKSPLFQIAFASFLALAPASAGQIQWASSYEETLSQSAAEARVVFVAVNMLGERANERMLADVYTESKIEELSKLTLNLVASNCWQEDKTSVCKAFRPLTLEELRELDFQIRENILRADDQGYVVAPQHIFLSPQGSVILSVPYGITEHEMEWCFVTAIQTVDPDADVKMSAKARAPKRLILGDVYDLSMGRAGRTLTRDEVLELIEQLRRGALRGEERTSAFRQVITADEPEAIDFTLDELRGGGSAGGGRGGGGRGGGGRGGGGRGGGGGGGAGGGANGQANRDRRPQILHQIGVNSPPSYWEVVVEFIEDSSDEVRNEAAVALEQLAAPKAYRAVSSALRKEKVLEIEKNMLRALGACGVEEKSARSTLLKVAEKDRELLLRVNAIFSLGYLLQNDDVREFLIETFHTGEVREQAAAALAMGLSREESWLEVLDPKGGADESPSEPEEAKDKEEELEDEVSAAVEAAKQVLTDGGLAPLEDPMMDTLEDLLARERLFGRAGGGGDGAEGGGGRGGNGGGRGGNGGGGGDDGGEDSLRP